MSAEFRAPCEDRGLENTPLTVKAEEELTEVRIKEGRKITEPKEARLLKKVTMLSVFGQRGLIRKGLRQITVPLSRKEEKTLKGLRDRPGHRWETETCAYIQAKGKSQERVAKKGKTDAVL